MKKIIAILACVCLVLTAAVVPAFAANDEIVLTVDSLGIPDQSYTSATATVDGVGFEWIQLGNYGSGIQVRDKDNKTSYFWNTTEFDAPIKEIKLVFNSAKKTYDNADAEIFSFGNAVDNYTYSTKLSTTADVKEYTITPDAETYTFLKFEHDLGFSMYWDSITIVLADDAGASSSQVSSTSSEEASSSDVASTSSEVASTSSEVASTSSEATTSTTTGTTSPATGDATVLLVAMALVVAAAVVVLATKKVRA